MFDLGSAKLKDYTATILHELAPYLNSRAQPHQPVRSHRHHALLSTAGYTNWDLSADRANAARRALEGGGLSADKVARIVGLSSSVLFDKDNSRNPINRRISIIVMTKEADESALKGDATPEGSAAFVPAGAGGAVAAPDAASALPSDPASAAVSATAPAPAPAAAGAPAAPVAAGAASVAAPATPK